METSGDPQEATTDAAPEGAADEGRPDAGLDRAHREHERRRDPDAEQHDPESGPASMEE
jgi:hypothetical protein